MDQQQFRCRGCHELKRQRVAEQKYCGATACQRARKNRWRRQRYAADADYRLTAEASTATWLQAQGGAAAYHRSYRQRRKQQQQRTDGERRKATSAQGEPAAPKAVGTPRANSDAKTAQSPIRTGQYLLVASGGTNSDAILVELRAIDGDFDYSQRTTDLAVPP